MKIKKNNSKRVVVTGIGPLSSIGVGKIDFWNSILAKKTIISKEEYRIDGDVWDEFLFHKVNKFDINSFGIDKAVLNEISVWKENEEVVDLFYLMAAAKLALDDSGFIFDREKNDISLVLAHENPGLDQFAEKAFSISYEILKRKNLTKMEFFKQAYAASFKSVYDLQTFMFLFHIGKALGTHGCSLFLNNACASGLYALEVASMLIKNNKTALSIVAAADHPDIFKYLWFKKNNMYAQDGKIKPFSENANGFVFGDGGCGIVLEELMHAKKRKAEIYAEYLGGSFVSEGWKVSLPAVGSKFYEEAISAALKTANVKPGEVDVVIPHGVGLKISDRYEANALNTIFGSKNKCPIFSAFKPYIGHNLGGSSLLETAILLLAMKHKLLPSTLNCDEISRNVPIGILRDKALHMRINTALKTSAAFAGFDAAIILKRFEQ